MPLRLESFDKALQMVQGSGFRGGGNFILPTPLNKITDCLNHNPSIDLNRFIGQMHMNATMVEHYNLAMLDHIDNFDELAWIELTSSVTKFKEMAFASFIQQYREFLIRTICFVFANYNELIPEKVRKHFDELPSDLSFDADLFDAVDRYYAGNIIQVKEKIAQSMGVNVWSNRFTLLKLFRLTEIRNCIVHHDGRKTSKFFRLCGAKYDRNFMPRAELKPFELWQTLIFLFRTAVKTDKEFLTVRDLPRSYIG